jgi:hypothetical protein
MEFRKEEVLAVEHATVEIEEKGVRTLNDLQLALIGGGIGDVVWG